LLLPPKPSGSLPHGLARKKAEKKEDLPPGWVRVESRSKKGSFYYAHPATKRTQAERPRPEPKAAQGPRRPRPEDLKAATEAKACKGISSRQGGEVTDSPAAVVDLEDEEGEAPAAAEQRRRREAEEEAEEALQRARERRAMTAQKRAAREEETLEAPPDEPSQAAESSSSAGAAAVAAASSGPAAAKAAAGQSRKAGMRAGSEGPAKKKKKKAWQQDESEEDGGEEAIITQEELDRWKEDNDWRESSTDNASDSDSEAEASAAAESAKGSRREKVPEPDEVFEPCLDVLKSELWVERHPLVGKEQWSLGRAVGQVDIPMQHESISRQHARIVRQGEGLFVVDLGSAHGTTLDGRPLLTNTLVRLDPGAQLHFGASTRLYVFHEPPATS